MLRIRTLPVLFLVLAVAGPGSVALAFERGDPGDVAVRSAELREAPGHLSAIRGHLDYGTRVEVRDHSQGFLRVRSEAGEEGWLHPSALSRDPVILTEDGDDVERDADRDEIALAGRGFNEEVEERYRRERGLSFAPVDRMEAGGADPEDLRAFIEQGELHLPGGE
ncbi:MULTISPECIES: SH3 domain-containing protein [unclassified Thioalkalivibrio]|uniref:SH3 domain-containing protein n=1 Tax=unclassified Thioalkalivibrio TaxID=2621013 RepID=UPI0003A56D07|nr:MULTISPECIES: SH3 domain-containing protein [unclassified Thioalkalivibrio]